jgi:hypothetical protein
MNDKKNFPQRRKGAKESKPLPRCVVASLLPCFLCVFAPLREIVFLLTGSRSSDNRESGARGGIYFRSARSNLKSKILTA